MVFACTSRSCAGTDVGTQAVFKALQAQLNRYVDAFLRQSKNPAVLAGFKLVPDGKLGAETVNTYKFVADGLIRAGVALTITPAAASTDQLARNADTLATLLQSVADRAGLPAGAFSVSPTPTAGFGPSAGNSGPLPPDLIAALRAGTSPSTSASPGLPSTIRLPQSELPEFDLESERLAPPPGAAPSVTQLAIYGGIGLLAIGAVVLILRKRRGA